MFVYRYTCHTPIDSEFASFRNGSWTGLVKEILGNTADVIVTSLDFTTQRSEAVDYLVGLRSIGYIKNYHWNECKIYNRFLVIEW